MKKIILTLAILFGVTGVFANTIVMDNDYDLVKGDAIIHHFETGDHLDANSSNHEITYIYNPSYKFIVPDDAYAEIISNSHELAGSNVRKMYTTEWVVRHDEDGKEHNYRFIQNWAYKFDDENITITKVGDTNYVCKCDNANDYNRVRHSSWTTVE